MPNKFHNDMSKKSTSGAATGQRGPDQDRVNEKVAAWPGLPGKSQGGDRSNGVKKLKTRAKSEGV